MMAEVALGLMGLVVLFAIVLVPREPYPPYEEDA